MQFIHIKHIHWVTGTCILTKPGRAILVIKLLSLLVIMLLVPFYKFTHLNNYFYYDL